MWTLCDIVFEITFNLESFEGILSRVFLTKNEGNTFTSQTVCFCWEESGGHGCLGAKH